MKIYKIVFLILIALTSRAQDFQLFYLNEGSTRFEDSVMDSLNQEIRLRISTKEFFEAINPTLSIIQRFSNVNESVEVHRYRYLLARLYYIVGLYSKSISNLEYCHVFFAQNKMGQELVRTCLLMALVQYKNDNTEQAAYFTGIAEAEKASKNNPYFFNKLNLLNAAIRDSLSDSTSLEKIRQVLKYSKASGMIELEALSYQLIGSYYLKKDLYSEANIAFQKAEEISTNEGYLAESKWLNQKIFTCFQKQEMYQEANLTLLKYIQIDDSLEVLLNKEDINKNIDKFEKKEIREDKIDLAKNQRIFELKSRRSNFTMISLLFGVGAILIAVFIIILFYQQRLGANEIILKQRDEINTQKIKDLENTLTLQNMKSMLQGQEDERERIAKDLHDSLGGLLSTIKLRFDKLEYDHSEQVTGPDFNKVHELIDVACKEVRNISQDLRPGALENLGLKEALHDLINRYNRNSGPEIFLQTYGLNNPIPINSEISTQAYRIIQELLNNAVKHAHATEIIVQVQSDDNILEITVEDNGIGYLTTEVKKGMGLDNISSRVQYLGAEISTDTKPGEGTSVVVTIPMHEAKTQGKP